jgi:hypothetical protein
MLRQYTNYTASDTLFPHRNLLHAERHALRCKGRNEERDAMSRGIREGRMADKIRK